MEIFHPKDWKYIIILKMFLIVNYSVDMKISTRNDD